MHPRVCGGHRVETDCIQGIHCETVLKSYGHGCLLGQRLQNPIMDNSSEGDHQAEEAFWALLAPLGLLKQLMGKGYVMPLRCHQGEFGRRVLKLLKLLQPVSLPSLSPG